MRITRFGVVSADSCMDSVHRHMAIVREGGDRVPRGVHIYCCLHCNCSSVDSSLSQSPSLQSFFAHPPLPVYIHSISLTIVSTSSRKFIEPTNDSRTRKASWREVTNLHVWLRRLTRILIFNQQSQRDAIARLKTLYHDVCTQSYLRFQHVMFCTNVTYGLRSSKVGKREEHPCRFVCV